VVATDDSAAGVSAVLEGMAAGRAVVVLDRGILGDLVADHVTGLVVRTEGDLPAAVHALAADGMRREAMGMAAADRVEACFATAVVVEALGRLVDEAGRPAYASV
jgi:glycosyltransferase involved in cell wall biosynthesis